MKELRSCRAQVTPPVAPPLSVSLSVVGRFARVCQCVCEGGEAAFGPSRSVLPLCCLPLSASPLPPPLSQRVCDSLTLSAPLSIALLLPFSLGVPYPQPLTPHHCHEPPRQNEESGSAEPLAVSLGLCTLFPSPRLRLAGLPGGEGVHSASPEGRESASLDRNLGNQKLLRNDGP